MVKSKISIEIDFENGNEPVIQILQRDSEDVRDNLIKSFLHSLGGQSAYCKISSIDFQNTPTDKFQRIIIKTVKPSELSEHADIMKKLSKV